MKKVVKETADAIAKALANETGRMPDTRFSLGYPETEIILTDGALQINVKLPSRIVRATSWDSGTMSLDRIQYLATVVAAAINGSAVPLTPVAYRQRGLGYGDQFIGAEDANEIIEAIGKLRASLILLRRPGYGYYAENGSMAGTILSVCIDIVSSLQTMFLVFIKSAGIIKCVNVKMDAGVTLEVFLAVEGDGEMIDLRLTSGQSMALSKEYLDRCHPTWRSDFDAAGIWRPVREASHA